MKNRSNKGFTLAEILIVVAMIGILISIATASINKSLEKTREATDLANIRSAMSRVQTAAIEDTGTDPANWRKYGPYNQATDNEKDLGTFDVVRCKNDGEMVYKVWIRSTQKQPGWQGDITSVGGYEIPELTGSYNAYRLLIRKSNISVIEVSKAKINENDKKANWVDPR